MMLTDVKKTPLEKQHNALQLLKTKVLQNHQAARDTQRFLLDLRNTCLELAYTVHMGHKDLTGRPYIQHVLRVAERASTVHGVCATLLGKVLQNGRELGLTSRTLIEDYMIPVSLMSTAEALVRRDGEAYDAYTDRVVQDYAAIKVAIETAIDNSNIARFDNPSMQDLDACSQYLGEALKFKTHANYQKNLRFEFLQDIIDLASLEKMSWTDEYARDDKELIELNLYFGYECCPERRIIMRYVAHIHPDTTVTMHVTTFCNNKSYNEQCLYKHRKTTREFPCVQRVYEYIEEVKNRLNASPNMALKRKQQTLAHVSLPVLLNEKFAIEELERRHS
jgi:hypothetical protein